MHILARVKKLFCIKEEILYDTAPGKYYLPTDAPRDDIINDMKEGRVFEPEVVDAAKSYIKEGSLVLDIGSNFGQMAVIFSRLVGKDGQVLAFEADNYIFSVLKKNIKANRCHNIKAFLGAVYDKSGRTVIYPVQDFRRFPSYGAYGLDPKAKSGRTVHTLAIDDLNIRKHISLMKIDIQGSDIFAMRGAVRTINKYRMPIIFEYEEQFQKEFNTTFQDYIDFVDSIAYKVDKVIYGINYVITPDTKKVFSPFPAGYPKSSLCSFLKSKQEIEECSKWLRQNGYISHQLVCKDWDLARIIPLIGDDNFLDMGSSDSYILQNLRLKKIRGKKYGIDLRENNAPARGVKYIVGDIVNTKFPRNFFKNITCLSVIEHGIDIVKLARESARILKKRGRIFITFDYWEPKIDLRVKMFGLSWRPLDKKDVEALILEFEKNGLYLIEAMDWKTDKAVIDQKYGSPHPEASYTFGMAVFEKK